MQEPEPAPMSIANNEMQIQARDVVPPPEPVPREPIKLDISDRLKKAESIRLDICNLMSQSKQKVNPEDINVPSIGKKVYGISRDSLIMIQRVLHIN